MDLSVTNSVRERSDKKMSLVAMAFEPPSLCKVSTVRQVYRFHKQIKGLEQSEFLVLLLSTITYTDGAPLALHWVEFYSSSGTSGKEKSDISTTDFRHASIRLRRVSKGSVSGSDGIRISISVWYFHGQALIPPRKKKSTS